MLTYTLTFDNTAGARPATVDTSDDLSDVLDDATLVAASITAEAGLTAVRDGQQPRHHRQRAGRRDPDGDLPGRRSSRSPTRATTCCPTRWPASPASRRRASRRPPSTRSGTWCSTKTSDRDRRQPARRPVTYTVTADERRRRRLHRRRPGVRGRRPDRRARRRGLQRRRGRRPRRSDPTYADPRVHLGRRARRRRHGDHHLHRDPQGRRRRCGPQRGLAPGPGRPAGPDAGLRRPDHDVPCDDECTTSCRGCRSPRPPTATELPAVGETMTYTVVVTNEGPGDYTAGAPATFTDDLSDVLDDATYRRRLDHRPTRHDVVRRPRPVAGPVCSPPASDATITYQVALHRRRRPVARQLRLRARGEAQDPGRARATPSGCAGSALTQTKSSDPADGTPVDVGDEITYTLTFTNAGPAPADRGHHRRPVRRPRRRRAGRRPDRRGRADRHPRPATSWRSPAPCRPVSPAR